ncbi:hypothetical protein [Reyranella sp.]|uniref:IS66 family insertion sequence element accessory protein TnpA n=1 Tax=Reyranella sp. TaxID=1929291 RepID=UPI0027320DB1|nr:hypothetical protein [Reyranella sp.]MDP2372440.1 hypothetical protein [Reyranella sp.]
MSDANVRAQLVETWKSRLLRFYDSDVTVAEFCAAESVSTPSFYQWQRRIQSLSPSFVPTERRRRKRQRPMGVESTSSPASATASASVSDAASATTMIQSPVAAPRSKPQPAFQPVQLTTTTCITPQANIQLPSGVIIELQHDANMICQVLERFLPLALQAGGRSC